jgi:hypothetical protein
MWQASSFAAEISPARLGLSAIRKTALIAGILVEDQRCFRKPLQSTGDKSGICGVARLRKLHPESVDAVLNVVLDQGKAALDCLAITLIRQ